MHLAEGSDTSWTGAPLHLSNRKCRPERIKRVCRLQRDNERFSGSPAIKATAVIAVTEIIA